MIGATGSSRPEGDTQITLVEKLATSYPLGGACPRCGARVTLLQSLGYLAGPSLGTHRWKRASTYDHCRTCKCAWVVRFFGRITLMAPFMFILVPLGVLVLIVRRDILGLSIAVASVLLFALTFVWSERLIRIEVDDRWPNGRYDDE
jgi:hypothetical protein